MNTPMSVVLSVSVPLLVRLAEQSPEPEDVKAGWLGFGVFLILAAAVVFLAFSLRKHLGKVDFEEPTDEKAPDGGDPDAGDPDAGDPRGGDADREGRGETATNGDRPSAL